MDYRFCAIIISVLGWPIAAFIAYRFAINSKKIDIKKNVYSNIREIVEFNWQRFRMLYKAAFRQKNMKVTSNGKPINTVGDYYNNLFKRLKLEVEQELLCHNDIIGDSERNHLLKIVNSISELAEKVHNIIPENDKFPKDLQKRYLNLKSRIRRIT